jgi:hypothetical protein
VHLQKTFPLHNIIDIVLSSPLCRAIQTTMLSFGPTLARPKAPFLVVPDAQEVSGRTCDVGFPREVLENEVREILKGQDLHFDIRKIDYGLVTEG